MTRAPFVLFFLMVSPLVLANTIYKCTDGDGNTLISNTKVEKNCRPVVGVQESALPAPKARISAATASPSPLGFPRVAEGMQKARDADRRRILEQELVAEQKSLEVARKDLAEQEAIRGNERNSLTGFDRLQPYKERVGQHDRNVQAINKELVNLR